MNDKLSKKIILFSGIFNYVLLAYLLIRNFNPFNFEFLQTLLNPITSTFIVIYSITSTILIALAIPGIVYIYYQTYSNCKYKEEPKLEEVTPLYKKVISLIRIMASIYFLNKFDFNYLSVILSLELFASLFLYYVEKDYTNKLLKIKLTWKDDKSDSFMHTL